MNYLKIISLSLVINSCALPQFSFKSGGSETKEIDAETVQIDYFVNKSAIGGPFLGASFTESLRDLMQSQTKLNIVDNNADLQIAGNIKNYTISPVNIQSGSETAAQNRLKMIVSVDTYYKKNDSIGLVKSPFSAFVDYNASTDFSSIEESLVEDLNYQITQDIYDKIFGGEW
ncbi:MAG: LptE family protein [Flavobacteriales bacterium]|jgi:hypothetical protein|nr:LptE family protein [Flavobacteriales bacterium]